MSCSVEFNTPTLLEDVSLKQKDSDHMLGRYTPATSREWQVSQSKAQAVKEKDNTSFGLSPHTALQLSGEDESKYLKVHTTHSLKLRTSLLWMSISPSRNMNMVSQNTTYAHVNSVKRFTLGGDTQSVGDFWFTGEGEEKSAVRPCWRFLNRSSTLPTVNRISPVVITTSSGR